MLEKAETHIKKIIESGILGPDTKCEYYPCHFQGQDCTWCFCPFYPCLDSKTGGKYVKSKRTGKDVWSCIECHWIHQEDISEKVLEEMRKDVDGSSVDQRKKIRIKILG